MTTGYKKNGVDIDTLLEPRTTGDPQAANTGYKVAGGADIATLFYPLANGGTAPSVTGFNVGGFDLSTIFAGIGTVSTIIDPWTVLVGAMDGYVYKLKYTDRWTQKSGTFQQIAVPVLTGYPTLVTSDVNYIYVVVGCKVYVRAKDNNLTAVRTIDLSSLFVTPGAVYPVGKSIAISNNKIGIVFNRLPAPDTDMKGTFVVIDLATDSPILVRGFDPIFTYAITSYGVFQIGDYLVTSRDNESKAIVFNTISNTVTTFGLGINTWAIICDVDKDGFWTRHTLGYSDPVDTTLRKWNPATGALIKTFIVPFQSNISVSPNLDVFVDIPNNMFWGINKLASGSGVSEIAFTALDNISGTILTPFISDSTGKTYNLTFRPISDTNMVSSRSKYNNPDDLYTFGVDLASLGNKITSYTAWNNVGGTTFFYEGATQDPGLYDGVVPGVLNFRDDAWPASMPDPYQIWHVENNEYIPVWNTKILDAGPTSGTFTFDSVFLPGHHYTRTPYLFWDNFSTGTYGDLDPQWIPAMYNLNGTYGSITRDIVNKNLVLFSGALGSTSNNWCNIAFEPNPSVNLSGKTLSFDVSTWKSNSPNSSSTAFLIGWADSAGNSLPGSYNINHNNEVWTNHSLTLPANTGMVVFMIGLMYETEARMIIDNFRIY